MTTAGQFIVELQKERRSGNVSSETDQHLKHEFRKLGWDASDETLATAIDSEIDRLEREAATLRKMRAGLFGVA
jgi:ribosome-associated translation inhibitor RaiA